VASRESGSWYVRLDSKSVLKEDSHFAGLTARRYKEEHLQGCQVPSGQFLLLLIGLEKRNK